MVRYSYSATDDIQDGVDGANCGLHIVIRSIYMEAVYGGSHGHSHNT